MSIDLNTNKQQLLDAWKGVCDNDNGMTWALFGYEGKSHVLKVVETGDGDLEDLVEELNGSKVMYAFCRVIDPNTKLPKFVLINWSGEKVELSVSFETAEKQPFAICRLLFLELGVALRVT